LSSLRLPIATRAPSAAALHAVDGAPTPAQQAEFEDTFEHLLSGLDPEARRIVELRLQEKNNEQIATELGCSERTVRRMLNQLEAKLRADRQRVGD